MHSQDEDSLEEYFQVVVKFKKHVSDDKIFTIYLTIDMEAELNIEANAKKRQVFESVDQKVSVHNLLL